MISVDQASFTSLEGSLTAYLEERVPGHKLLSMSVLDNRVSLHYQYRRRKGFDWMAFMSDLEQLAHPSKVETFVG